MTGQRRGIARLAAVAAALGALLVSADALAAGSAIKLAGPTSVQYGATYTYTVSGHGSRVRGSRHNYPPNLVFVDVLTSPSPRCPRRLGGRQTNLRQVLKFHSQRVNQVLSQFSRTVKVRADGHAYGLCAYLLNFPAGGLYAHTSAYWTVTGTPAPPPKYTLTVSTSGTEGEVDSSDYSIACGNGATHCSHAYAPGATVTLTEYSQPNSPIFSSFAGWGGACSGTDVSCTVTMDSNKTVTATFEATPQ